VTVAHRVLVVIAHPDDEVTMGGTIARCAAEGAEVTLVCATAGAGGGSDSEDDPLRLTAIRTAELDAAARVLGVRSVVHLEEPDSDQPYLRRGNYHLAVQQHEQQIAALVHDVRPDAVLTFGPDGVTGHDTHVAVGAMTERALVTSGWRAPLFRVAFGAEQITAVQAWITAHPACLHSYQQAQLRNPALGAPVPEFVAVPDDTITTRVDVRPWMVVKQQAAACHASQGGGGGILDALCAPDNEAFVEVGSGPSVLTGHVLSEAR
jgi:LmbE family N-acetylglucosaminyl deacetylase